MLRAIRDAPETSRGTESVCGEVKCGGGSEFGLRLTMSRRTGPMPSCEARKRAEYLFQSIMLGLGAKSMACFRSRGVEGPGEANMAKDISREILRKCWRSRKSRNH